MAEGEKAMTVEEPGKAQTGGKKRMNLRIGGPGVLVGAVAVAFVIGAAIRIRRSRSLHKARKRFQCSCTDDSYGGLCSILQANKGYPRYSVDGTSEAILNRTLEENGLEEGSKLEQDEIQTGKIEEDEGDEASDTDHGEWMTNEIMESSAEEEDSANEAQGEEDYDDAEDEVADSEAEEENDDADDDDEYEDEDEDGDDGECVIEKCEEGLQGTGDSSMESNEEAVWPVEMEEWPLEIKDMEISYLPDKIAKTQTYKTRRRGGYL